MHIPSWAVVAAALVAAVPFGWLLGVFGAELMLGPDIGVFPVVTIPVGLAAGIALALAPVARPAIRLAIIAAGTVLLALVA
jgi:hypothetical protein